MRAGEDQRQHLPILVLVLLVDGGHQRGRWWENLVDKDKDGLVRGQLDALADDVDELADCQVCWDEILLLVDGSNVTLLDLFADNLREECVSVVSRGVEVVGSSGGRRRWRWLVQTMMLFGGLTGMRSRYFWRIRSASALRFSKGCSSLNLDRILVEVGEAVARSWGCGVVDVWLWTSGCLAYGVSAFDG